MRAEPSVRPKWLASLGWRRLGGWVQLLALALVVYFAAAAVREHWHAVSSLTLRDKVPDLALGFGLCALAMFGLAWLWHRVLEVLGVALETRTAWAVYSLSQVGKYVPGRIWAMTGRVGLAVDAGVPLQPATTSVLLEQVLLLLPAGVLGGVGLASLSGMSRGSWWLLLLALFGVFLVVAQPRILSAIGSVLARGSGRGSFEPLRARTGSYFALLLGFAAAHGLLGGSFVIVLNAFEPIALDQILPLTLVFVASWAAGFVAFLVPAGLGVREGALLLALGSVAAPEAVLAAVVTHRLLSVLVDAALALLSALYLAGSRGAPEAGP